MSDWQIGDLALCVEDGPSVWGQAVPAVRGRIYTVMAIVVDGQGLTFLEIPHPNAEGYRKERFVKVTPPAADEFDRETIALMNRVGEPVQ